MTVRVVDPFEVVQIGNDYGKHRRLALGAHDLALHVLQNGRAVRHAGERIARRLQLQFLLHPDQGLLLRIQLCRVLAQPGSQFVALSPQAPRP